MQVRLTATVARSMLMVSPAACSLDKLLVKHHAISVTASDLLTRDVLWC